LGMPDLDILHELKDITPTKLFGEWLPQLVTVFTPVVAWLMDDLKAAISIKLDDGEWTCEFSEDGLKVDEGLSDDAMVTVVMSEKDFLSVVTGERKMAMMPSSDQPVDITEFPEMVKKNIETLKGIEAVLLLKVEDPDAGDLVVKVKFAGPMKDQPDTQVGVAQDVLEDMASGALDPAGAFILGGQVQVEGDVNLLMKLAMMMM
jgi:putative sterol carrier protein